MNLKTVLLSAIWAKNSRMRELKSIKVLSDLFWAKLNKPIIQVALYPNFDPWNTLVTVSLLCSYSIVNRKAGMN